MTSEEIKKLSEDREKLAEEGKTLHPTTFPLWEVAYQLAKQTEQQGEMIQLLKLQVSRINPQPLADPQPGKRDAEAERGKWDTEERWQQKDWNCAACGYANKPIRSKCRNCQAPNPEAVAFLADPQPGKRATETGPGTLFQHYYSTACQHGQHETCRLRCKFCQSPCLCDCHSQRPQPSEAATEAGSQGDRGEGRQLMTKAERDAIRARVDHAVTAHITWNEADAIAADLLAALDALEAQDATITALQDALRNLHKQMQELNIPASYLEQAETALLCPDPGAALIQRHAGELAAIKKTLNHRTEQLHELLRRGSG